VTSSTQCLLSFSFSFFERGLTSSSSSELSPSRIRILSLFAIYATALRRTHLFALTSCKRLSVAFLSKLSLNIFSRMNFDSLTLIPIRYDCMEHRLSHTTDLSEIQSYRLF